MFLFCGLGNPGDKYKNTRHNVGFKLANKLMNHYEFDEVKIDKSKELYSGKIKNFKILILKPLTYMNLSGGVISETLNFYKIKLENLYVIHDDLDLQLAKVKIKKGGGNGGHNGLESIDQYLTKEYNRIRIGIDHPGEKYLVSNYVLNDFLTNEEKILEKKLDKIVFNFDLIFNDLPLFLTKISEEKQ